MRAWALRCWLLCRNAELQIMNALHGPRWSRSDMHMQHAHPQLGQHACSLLLVVLHLALETAAIGGVNQMHPISSKFYVELYIALGCYERLLESSCSQQMNVCCYDSYLFPACISAALLRPRHRIPLSSRSQLAQLIDISNYTTSSYSDRFLHSAAAKYADASFWPARHSFPR